MNDARKIIHLLAHGIDPITGEVLPDTSPYNQPRVIRALFTVLETDTAKKNKPKTDRNLPVKHGKPWAQDERDYAATSYKNGITVKEIAAHLQRTTGSIRSELIRQGLIQIDEPQPILA